MLPKKIHYIWLGENEKSDLVKKCIQSWKTYMPDYEIIEWNENNLDLECCKYAKKAYEKRKWAFASDYFRFSILYNQGGVYFDTDVELIKSIPDVILGKEVFTGLESNNIPNPGLIFASPEKNNLVKYMMEKYESIDFDEKKLVTVNRYLLEYLLGKGFVANGLYQEIEGLAIYPSSYFCGFDLDVREISVKEETIAIHHYAGSWKKKTIKRSLQNMLKKMIGVEKYRRILNLKRKVKNVFGQ